MSSKAQTIDIHGKAYVTVAERVRVAHEDLQEISISTEVLANEPVVIKATVNTPKGVFTGISAANPSKMIEKQSPYEVAETSAVGRALGFAGYGIVDGIATADEIHKAEVEPLQEDVFDGLDEASEPCLKCNQGQMVFRKGVNTSGRPWAAKFCNHCDNKSWINLMHKN